MSIPLIRFNVVQTTDYDCDGITVGYHKVPATIETIDAAQTYMSAEHPYAGYTVTDVWTKHRFTTEILNGASAFAREHWNDAGYYNPAFDDRDAA